MSQVKKNRRSFMSSAAMGTALLAVRSTRKDSVLHAAQQKIPSIFICSVCGHIQFGTDPKVCPICHAPAEKFSRNDQVFEEAEAKSQEVSGKHVPAILVKKSMLVVEQPSMEVTVRVGKILHPMTTEHHIRFIDCYVDDQFVSRADLTVGVHPTATFTLKTSGSRVRIVEFCNLHSYWQTEAVLK